jgi:hypothetical protein
MLKFNVDDKARAHKEGMRIGKTPKKLIAYVALNAEKLMQIL